MFLLKKERLKVMDVERIPTKKVFTISAFLNDVLEKFIANDAAVQRKFVWKKEHINELIYSVLTEDYIPAIIMGEFNDSQLHIADGGQRTSALMLFRYGNYTITSSIENSIVKYKKRVEHENGTFTYEYAEFDIKNTTYDKLPDELKRIFDGYQIETVIIKCDSPERLSKYIKRFNNHVPMNVAQRAFTCVDNFATEIREITNDNFFVNCDSYKENDRKKGTLERVVINSMMCIKFMDNWNKDAKKNATYINQNATTDDFKELKGNLLKLDAITCDDEDMYSLFTTKNSHIWFAVFDKFVKSGTEDKVFYNFLKKFKEEYSLNPEWVEIDTSKNTNDKSTIVTKIELLVKYMKEYGIDIVEENDIDQTSAQPEEKPITDKNVEVITNVDSEVLSETESIKAFVNDTVDNGIELEDIEFYSGMLNDYTLEVDNDTKLLDKANRKSLIALIVYADRNEKDNYLDGWFIEYFANNHLYDMDQIRNFNKMKSHFDSYVLKKGA